MQIKIGFLTAIFGISLVPTFIFSSPKVEIHVKLNPIGSFVATGDSVSGFLLKEGDRLTAEKVEFTIESLKTGISLRDQHMKEKYLEASKFPKAIGTITEAKDGQFKGTLTVHGVSQPITGKYILASNEATLEFPTKISAFQIAKASYMGVGAADDLTVSAVIPVQIRTTPKIDVAATKKPAVANSAPSKLGAIPTVQNPISAQKK